MTLNVNFGTFVAKFPKVVSKFILMIYDDSRVSNLIGWLI
jgi:hypothetical protein